MRDKLAMHGGRPVRKSMLPYGRQIIDDSDINAVVEVLRGEWLTTGPVVNIFEEAFAEYTGAAHAVAVNSGTAALHACMFAAGVGPGDEVIVPGLSFAASANCVLYLGGRPVFADVEPDTLLIDEEKVESLVTSKTRAIVAVDYSGQPCNYECLKEIAERYNLVLVADACHSLGATFQNQKVGTLADLNAFSFHPVKHITTAEGGMITTNNEEMARQIRWFRNHGITTNHRQRAIKATFAYDMVALGYNYRLPDLNCALGLSQLRKLDKWVAKRREIADQYDQVFTLVPNLQPLTQRIGRHSSWHIYPVLLDTMTSGLDRDEVFTALRAENIGVNVHYIPIYRHSYYVKLGYSLDTCPVVNDVFKRLLTLPIHPAMIDSDVNDVVNALKKVLTELAIEQEAHRE